MIFKKLKYLIIGTIILSVILIWNISKYNNITDILGALSNSFFLLGILSLCFGLFTFINKSGFLDIYIYGIYMLFCKFKYNLNDRKYKDFYEYKNKKSLEKRGNIQLVLSGIVFIFLSIISTILYTMS